MIKTSGLALLPLPLGDSSPVATATVVAPLVLPVADARHPPVAARGNTRRGRTTAGTAIAVTMTAKAAAIGTVLVAPTIGMWYSFSLRLRDRLLTT
jgi:hypothetical protein